MARHILQLRLAGLRNRARAVVANPNKRGSAFISALVFAWLAYRYGPTVVDVLRTTGAVPGAELILPMLSFSVLLSWIMGPLAGYSPGPFAVDNFRLLPLRPRQLASGILLASVVSPGLLVSAAFVGVTLSSFSATPAGWAFLVAATAVLLASCIVAARLVGLGVGVLSRHRRSRDLLVLVSLPVSLVPLFLLFEVSQAYQDPAAGSPVVGVVQWVPLAWPGRTMAAAAAEQFGEASIFLLASLLLLVAGWVVVTWLVRLSLLGEDRSRSPVTGSAHPFAAFARRLPATRLGAVAAADIRVLVRDSSRVPQLLIGTLVLGGMFTALGVAALAGTDEQYAVLGALGLALVPVTRRIDEFGLSGPAYWMEVVAPGSPRDDLLGRDLAAIVLDAPLCLIVLTAVAVGTRSLAWLPVAVVFVAAAVAISYTVTRVTSTVFATGQSVAKDAASRSATSRDPRTIGVQLGAMIAVIAAAAPIVAAVVEIVRDGTTWAVPLVVGVAVYGIVVYLVGLALMSRWLGSHEPDLLARIGG